MEIKTYAPVIIPTLNRYEHFKKCLESLEKCTGAEKTEVYIALDYPPSDKYVEGWKKLDAYLREKEQNSCFLKLKVFRREQNCGVGTKNSNVRLLKKYICEKYDRYIFSEDDNVFSNNFLEYVNKGLERFKDDERIFAICGYSHPYKFKTEESNYFFHNTDFSAWGCGMWTKKTDIAKDYIYSGQLKKNLSFHNIIEEWKHGNNRLSGYIHYCLNMNYDNIRITDNLYSVYMIATNKCVVMPSISKVRNIGWDGSGISNEREKKKNKRFSEIALAHMAQEIDSEEDFEFNGDPERNFEYNNEVAAKESDGKIGMIKCLRSILSSILKYFKIKK